MQRHIEITVPSEQTEALLQEIRGQDGLLGLRVERGISEHPRGDLISIEVLSKAYREILFILERRGVGKSSSSSISISQTNVVISPTVKHALGTESDVYSWESVHALVARTSNMSLYILITMFIAGFIAAIGIITGSLHVAVGAFIIAPGFEPIIRVPLGIISKSPAWLRGIQNTLVGYLCVIAGAFAAALFLKTSAAPLLSGPSAYFSVQPLIDYWTVLSYPSALTAFTGALVGTVMVLTGRSVLTAGVMVALALIPTSTIVGIAFAAGDFAVAGAAFGRFAAEVGLVFAGSVPPLLWWRVREQKRSSML